MKWRGKLNLISEEESWLKVLCCRRPNKVRCKNYSSTPGISVHAFPKKAKRKQKWTTFARIFRLACQRNTLPCAPSILKYRVSAEVCLLGHQWISRGFTLRKVQYRQYHETERLIGHWLPKKWGKTCKLIFFQRNVLGRFFATLPSNFSIQNPSPPPKKNRFFFGLGRPILVMLSIFRDDRSTTLYPRTRGWA